MAKVNIRYTWLPKLMTLLPMVEFFADFYRNNSSPADRYYAICTRFAKISWRIVVTATAAIECIWGSFLLMALLECLRRGEMVPVLLSFIPGVYELLPIGNIFVHLFNYAELLSLMILEPACDLLFFVLFGNIPMVPAILQQQMQELSTILLATMVPDADVDVAEIKRRFLHFVDIHRCYNE